MALLLRQRGLAIATVLLAVVLVAAIAVVIASASRSGQSNSQLQQARLDATTLMTQAQNYKNGLAIMESKGGDPSTITFDAAANTGLWNPVAGGHPSRWRCRYRRRPALRILPGTIGFTMARVGCLSP